MWIESHVGLIRHRKVLFLSADLSIKPVQTVGHLTALWHAVMEQQEDGDLSEWTDQMIAEVSLWEGDPSAFVSALKLRRFLDEKMVHDWLDYAGRYLQTKYRTANPKKLKAIYKIYKSVPSQSKNRLFVTNSAENHLGKGRYVEVGKGEGSDSEEERKWPCPELLIKKYNDETPDELASVEKISPARIAKAKSYLKVFPDLEFWTEAFVEIHKSKFLRGLRPGQNGHKPFCADFDWLLTKGKDSTENLVKVWEGKYRDG